MKNLRHTLADTIQRLTIPAIALASFFGCYQYDGAPPASQTNQPGQNQETPQPSGSSTSTGYTSAGGGSALGGAKRTATNIADQAQQHSQDVADQADELFDE